MGSACVSELEESPKLAQDAPEMSPRWPNMAQGDSTKAQNGPKMAAPEGMMLAVGSPVGHDIAPQTCKNNFKIPSYLAT